MRVSQLKSSEIRTSVDTILVGIDMPQMPRQLALQRAAQLAQRSGARLTLFSSAYSPQLSARNMSAQGARDALAGQRALLDKLAAPLLRRGLSVTTRVAADYPAYEGLVREVLKSKPDLVVVESRRRAFGSRLFLTNTDWQLIRLCPAPLLFVKQERNYGKVRVLAAIDPLHANGKPARLDERIMELAWKMTTVFSGKLHVVHATMPLSSYLPGSYGEAIALPIDPNLDRKHELQVRKVVERSVAKYELPRSRLHLELGDAQAILPLLARRLGIDMVVMGAMSRHGLDRLLIGSTAERVIDKLHCDVLVVKLRNFKTSVARKPPRQQPQLPEPEFP